MKKVAAAIAVENGKILIAKRAKHLKLGGYWEFPGGKVEGVESIYECITRELEEELSVKCEAGQVITSSVYKYEHGEFEIIGISVKGNFSEVKLRDHDRIQWVYISEIMNYQLAPADIAIAKFIMEHPNEF